MMDNHGEHGEHGDKAGVTTKGAKDAKDGEIEGKDYTVGSLMVALLKDEIPLPVWVRFGCSRHRVTQENVRDVCRGLLMALELRTVERDE